MRAHKTNGYNHTKMHLLLPEEVSKCFLEDVLHLEGKVGILWAEQKNVPIWQGKVIHVCDWSPGSMVGGREGVLINLLHQVDQVPCGTTAPIKQSSCLLFQMGWAVTPLTQENKRQRKETQPLLPTCILNLNVSTSWVLDFGEIHSSLPPMGLRHKMGDISTSSGHGLFNIYSQLILFFIIIIIKTS